MFRRTLCGRRAASPSAVRHEIIPLSSSLSLRAKVRIPRSARRGSGRSRFYPAQAVALRASELRPGGQLVVALPSLAHDGSMDIAPLMDHANAVLAELVDAGVVSAEERSRMTIASCPRRERDLLAPFTERGQFKGLTIEHVSTHDIPDSMWTDYARDGDAMALASKRALFFRVIFVPSIVQALAATRSGEERRAFADRLEEGVRRRLARAPARINSLVGIIVLAKQPATNGKKGQTVARAYDRARWRALAIPSAGRPAFQARWRSRLRTGCA